MEKYANKVAKCNQVGKMEGRSPGNKFLIKYLIMEDDVQECQRIINAKGFQTSVSKYCRMFSNKG